MHTQKIIWPLALALAFTLSGCGNWSSVYHTHQFTDNSSALVDINTRTILSSRKITDTTDPTTKTTVRTTIDRTCAEPSPDALTTYAANLSVSKNIAPPSSLSLSGGYTSDGQYVGNRTETIQLLRDQLYRLCEAYINNAIDDDTYEMLMLRSQRYTLALMATDSLSQMANSKNQPSTALKISDTQKAAKAELEKLKADETTLNTSNASDKETKLSENKKLQDAQSKIIADEVKKSGDAAKTPITDTSNNAASESATNAMILIVSGLIGSGDEAYKCFNYMRTLEKENITTTAIKGSPGEILRTFCTSVFNRVALGNTNEEPNTPTGSTPNTGVKKVTPKLQMLYKPTNIKSIMPGSGI